MINFRPMLADSLESLSAARFPLLASPKLDGIRCVMHQGKALSRSLKPIPNNAARAFLEGLPIAGLDGELMVHGVPFHEVTSTFMGRKTALPGGWYFAVFDSQPVYPAEPYTERLARVRETVAALPAEVQKHVVVVTQLEVATVEQLEVFEAKALALGFEGVMLRRAAAGYKFGRSTASDGALLKWKRFSDAEAEIVGVAERLHNGNASRVTALGTRTRGSSKAGKTPTASLGALVVRDRASGVEFEIGSGFSEQQRQEFWREQVRLVGLTVTYRHFAVSGVKDKPRFPIFVGFRAREDM